MNNRGEGLKAARLMMVLSSLTPLFLLWAIKGVPLIKSWIFLVVCLLFIFVPNCILLLRMSISIKKRDKKTLTIGSWEDHRDHLLVYLFAMLLPLYTLEMNTWREFSAAMVAFVFIVFLFWHLNMHYMNVFFAIRGYRVFTIYPTVSVDNPFSGSESYVLITRRCHLKEGEQIDAFRLSNTVYFEKRGVRG